MPIEQLVGFADGYYLIAFDKEGRERADDPVGRMSERAREALVSDSAGPVTDVFLMSHGWKGDVPGAREQYSAWAGAMAACRDDIGRIRDRRPGFRPLVVGLHWPSLPWGDEDLSPSVSFGPAGTEPATVEALVEEAAERTADTPAARAALRLIFERATEDAAPPELPPEVREAYLTLDREADLGGEGPAAAPGDDREPFDPDRAYAIGQEDAVAFGGLSDGLLSPLRQLSFWKMKDRGRRFGESGAHRLLADLQRSVPDGRRVRFHLMGHSFGCVVMSAAVCGPPGRHALPRPVDSLVLVQGALSLWSYDSEIELADDRPGYFRSLVEDGRVAGPVVATLSEWDTAVGRLYPHAAGVAGQVAFAPGDLPKYGGVGTFGGRGTGLDVVDFEVRDAGAGYDFEPRKFYNLECGRVIRNGGGVSGAHSDIAHPEIAHAVWTAAIGADAEQGPHSDQRVRHTESERGESRGATS